MRAAATRLMWSGICAIALAAPSPVHADEAEAALAAKIRARLAAQYYSSASHIVVKADAAGIVWLSGTVPTSDACSHAVDVAKNTDGVTAVHNQIRVR